MTSDFNVAIIGGGLCGLALALGLEARGVPYTLYEARGSFTEIGAGINVGPSAVESLRLIRPSLGALVYALSTRNLPPHDEVFMLLRRGAPSSPSADDDAAPVADLHMPPTGSMTLHRQEFLSALASELELTDDTSSPPRVPKHTRFHKKLLRYAPSPDGVLLTFTDGTSAPATLAIGTDGIHSQVRAHMFSAEPGDPRAQAHFFHEGAYRAILPLPTLSAAIGPAIARRSTIWLGPGGYIIMYPISGGTQVNVGVWAKRPGSWATEGGEWVVRDQRARMMGDFADWGPTVQKLLAEFPAEVPFWAAHQHAHQPRSCRDGRVLLIGDAAHAMPPHQGAGAATAVEDAYVLAEVLGEAYGGGEGKGMDGGRVEAALRAVEEVRGPRSATIHRYSCDARDRWADFHEHNLQGEALEEFLAETRRRLEWIWNVNMAGEAEKAKKRMVEILESQA